jgi:Zn ribbon nucleic-acid-binding protein
MVDNILNDKEDATDSLASISDSEEGSEPSDLKDSLCDSPTSYHSANNINSSLSDDETSRSYTMIKEHRQSMNMELCCAKCGHYQNAIGKNLISQDGQIDFKCLKCGFHEFLNSKDTMLKETTKPVLKFSVSAILSDSKRDCVKVRNGELNCDLFKIKTKNGS